VPRYDKDNKISKCHLCYDRIAEGLQPACAKTCPTGALRFGDRDKLIESAKQAGYSKIYGEADLGGLGSIFAFKDPPTLYGYAEKPNIPESVIFWHNVLKPLAVIGLGGAVAGALIHYALIGPHKDEEVKKS
jgi:formate dehydrogenase iron-sulfur subunit